MFKDLATADMNQQIYDFYCFFHELAAEMAALRRRPELLADWPNQDGVCRRSAKALLEHWSGFSEMYMEHSYSEEQLAPFFKCVGGGMMGRELPEGWNLRPYVLAFVSRFLDGVLAYMRGDDSPQRIADGLVEVLLHPERELSAKAAPPRPNVACGYGRAG